MKSQTMSGRRLGTRLGAIVLAAALSMSTFSGIMPGSVAYAEEGVTTEVTEDVTEGKEVEEETASVADEASEASSADTEKSDEEASDASEEVSIEDAADRNNYMVLEGLDENSIEETDELLESAILGTSNTNQYHTTETFKVRGYVSGYEGTEPFNIVFSNGRRGRITAQVVDGYYETELSVNVYYDIISDLDYVNECGYDVSLEGLDDYEIDEDCLKSLPEYDSYFGCIILRSDCEMNLIVNKSVEVSGGIFGIDDGDLDRFVNCAELVFIGSEKDNYKSEKKEFKATIQNDGTYFVRLNPRLEYDIVLNDDVYATAADGIRFLSFKKAQNTFGISVTSEAASVQFSIEGVDPSELSEVVFKFVSKSAIPLEYDKEYDSYECRPYSFDELMSGKVRLKIGNYKVEILDLPDDIVYKVAETKDLKVQEKGEIAYTIILKKNNILENLPYKEIISVGEDKDYKTINAALAAIERMDRNDNQRVTVLIDPGDYHEMLRIHTPNVTFRNAVSKGSIMPINGGTSIEDNTVRITSYYAQGYDYYSMGVNGYDPEILEVSKYNGYCCYWSHEPGYWWPEPDEDGWGYYYYEHPRYSTYNTTVIINALGFEAFDIVFENSYGRYISDLEKEDCRESEATWTTFDMEEANAVYVGDGSYFNHCAFVGNNNTLSFSPGKLGASFYNCDIYGTEAYDSYPSIPVVFAKCRIILDTIGGYDETFDGNPIYRHCAFATNDCLMYNCRIISAIPGVNTASKTITAPGTLGKKSKGIVHYYTVIDKTNDGTSLIIPEGWQNEFEYDSNGDPMSEDREKKGVEYGTIELSGVDNSDKRSIKVSSEPKTADGRDISVSAFLGDWDPFAEHGDDMTIDYTGATFAEVNVTNFGAKGDGITDDTQAIKEALAAADGKKLYVPAGNYCVSSIDLSNLSVEMYSDGDACFIKNDATSIPIFNITNARDCKFTGITFDAGSEKFGTSKSTACVFFRNASNVEISNCQFRNSSKEAMIFYGNAENINVHDNSFSNTGDVIWFKEGTAKHIQFENNVANDGRNNGVIVGEKNDASQSYDIVIRGNEFHNFANGAAVQLRGASQVKVENNTVDNAKYFIMGARPFNNDYDKAHVTDLTVTGNHGSAKHFVYLYTNEENPNTLYSNLSFANNDFSLNGGPSIYSCDGISFSGDHLAMSGSAPMTFVDTKNIELNKVAFDAKKSSKELMKFDACDVIALKNMNVAVDRVLMNVVNSEKANISFDNMQADFGRLDESILYSTSYQVNCNNCVNTGKAIGAKLTDKTLMIPVIGKEFEISSDKDIHIATVRSNSEKGDVIKLSSGTSNIYFDKGGNIIVSSNVFCPKDASIEMEFNGKKWTLKQVPVTITVSGDCEAAVGETAEFSVKAAGGSGEFEYRWYRSSDSGKTWAKSSYTGATTEKLSVTVKQNMIDYKFRCRVRDKGTNTDYYSDNMGFIQPSVVISQNPKDRKVKEGQDAAFAISATGTIKSYQWYRSKDNGQTWSKVYHPGYKTSNMTVPTKSYMSGYQFYCEVTDNNGKKYNSKAAKLTVTK